MKYGNIVKVEMQRSSSSEGLKIRPFNKTNLKPSRSKEALRNPSLERSTISKSIPRLLEKNSSKELVLQTKKSSKQINSTNSFKVSHKKPTETQNDSLAGQEKSESTNVKIQKSLMLISKKTSKFTLKMVEKMKKEYMITSNHEIIYKSFLAILSQIDPIFNDNQVLQFTMSRAREIFQLYFSRPGHVLQTIKSLSKLVETVRISKKLLSQCKNQIKTVNEDKIDSSLAELCDIMKNVILVQDFLFKAKKLFKPKDDIVKVCKTQENLLTEEKTLDISIMELHTLPSEQENRTISPFLTFDSEDTNEVALPLKPLHLNMNKSSSKSKLLEKLYTKMTANDKNDLILVESFDSDDNKSLDFQKIDQKITIFNGCAGSSIKIKKNRRNSSSLVKPNYMKSLSKCSSFVASKPLIENVNEKTNPNNFSKDRKEEWEEIRKVIFI